MKKSIFFFTAACFALCFTATSCKKELKNVRGEVRNVIVDDDTLRSLTLMVGEDSMVFHLEEARFNNGMMLPHDSAIVDYIDGKNDTARALVVTVLPKVQKTIDPSKNENQKLLTAPVEKK